VGAILIKGEQFLDAVHEFFGFGAFHMCDVVGVGEGEQYRLCAGICQASRSLTTSWITMSSIS
jgi:hypothetical protein